MSPQQCLVLVTTKVTCISVMSTSKWAIKCHSCLIMSPYTQYKGTSSNTGLGRSHPYHFRMEVVYYKVTSSSKGLGRSHPYHLNM